MPRRNNNKPTKQRPVATQQTTCQSKVHYNSRQAAEDTIAKRSVDMMSPALGTYHCPTCLGWHLTRVKDDIDFSK